MNNRLSQKIILNELPLLMVILSILQIVLMIVQIAYSAMVFTGVIVVDGLYDGGYVVFVVIVVLAINLLILRNVMRTIRSSYAQINEQKETIRNIESLNNSIRSQRHDFLNHMQVLYSLMELEEYEEARQYLNKLYGDIETTNVFLKTGVLAVNALLQVKYGQATGRGIPMHLDIGSQLADAPLSDWDMCKLLGNLIDNALRATEQYEGESWVQVGLNENIRGYVFTVSNTGEPPKDVERIFEPGYTTKQAHGEGMGLFIVKQITDAHRGTVSCEAKDARTTFTVTLPRRGRR